MSKRNPGRACRYTGSYNPSTRRRRRIALPPPIPAAPAPAVDAVPAVDVEPAVDVIDDVIDVIDPVIDEEPVIDAVPALHPVLPAVLPVRPVAIGDIRWDLVKFRYDPARMWQEYQTPPHSPQINQRLLERTGFMQVLGGNYTSPPYKYASSSSESEPEPPPKKKKKKDPWNFYLFDSPPSPPPRRPRGIRKPKGNSWITDVRIPPYFRPLRRPERPQKRRMEDEEEEGPSDVRAPPPKRAREVTPPRPAVSPPQAPVTPPTVPPRPQGRGEDIVRLRKPWNPRPWKPQPSPPPMPAPTSPPMPDAPPSPPVQAPPAADPRRYPQRNRIPPTEYWRCHRAVYAWDGTLLGEDAGQPEDDSAARSIMIRRNRYEKSRRRKRTPKYR